jgi:aminoglycoside phosphotransferase (APT) family kinase protein
MTGRVLQPIVQAWAGDWQMPGRPPVSALLAGIDRTPEAKVSLLLFDDSGAVVAVAKVPRDDRGAAAVRAEHAALRWAWSIASLRPTVPRPIGLLELDGRPVLVQSAVAGKPMTASYYTPGHTSNQALVERDFEAAGDWLDAFVGATRYAEVSLAEVTQRWIGPLVDRYRGAFGTSPDEDDLLAAVLDRAHGLGGETVPLAARHGDFWMGNLLLEGDVITGVIDWELARERDAAGPFSDAFKLPTSYGLYLDRPWPWAGGKVPGHPGREDVDRRWRRWGSWRNLVGFGHVWFGDGWLADLVLQWVSKRWATLGVNPAVAGTFFPLFIMEQTLTLQDPETRDGWRSALCAFAAEREHCRVWRAS